MGGWGQVSTSDRPCALVVDDDALILMHISDILEAAGFDFIEAGTGDEAKQRLGTCAEHVELLFSDVEMPGGTDGFALARHVAQHWPWIEIVMASGRVAPGPGEMPDGATFIPKPFTAEMVHDHLRDKLPSDKQPEPLRRTG